jgi:ZIP family zinc transporter
MGFSIYISLPLVLKLPSGNKLSKLLLAAAIGILVFIMADVWGDSASIMYNGSLYGYGTSAYYDAIFTGALCFGFLALFLGEHGRRSGLSPSGTSLIISLGIGFQNLTEGLVFGALAAGFGLSGIAVVILIGFILQNITEGFPIASPFLGLGEKKPWSMAALYFVGGFPTVLGGAFGFFYSSGAFEVFFDGLAIGAILYAVLPMLRSMFRESDRSILRVTYLGVFLGFLLGFLVNLI